MNLEDCFHLSFPRQDLHLPKMLRVQQKPYCIFCFELIFLVINVLFLVHSISAWRIFVVVLLRAEIACWTLGVATACTVSTTLTVKHILNHTYFLIE